MQSVSISCNELQSAGFDSVLEQILNISMKKFFLRGFMTSLVSLLAAACSPLLFTALVSLLATGFSLVTSLFSLLAICESLVAAERSMLAAAVDSDNEKKISIKFLIPVSKPSSELPDIQGISCFSGLSVFAVFPKSIHFTMGSSRN